MHTVPCTVGALPSRTPRLSRWLGHSSPALCFLSLYTSHLPSVKAAQLGKHDRSKILTQEWGCVCRPWGMGRMHSGPFTHTPPPARPLSQQWRQRSQISLGQGATESRRFIWQEAYVQRVGRAVSAGRQLHSRLGNPKGPKEPSTRRPACCQSWTGRWQRPAAHTVGSCNPW